MKLTFSPLALKAINSDSPSPEEGGISKPVMAQQEG